MHVPHAGRDPHVANILATLPSEWDVQVVTDPQRKGCWPTARRAWEARTPSSTHHVVLSDDAVLCDHFGELLIGAIAAKPDAVMSLCTRARLPVDNAVIARRSWLHSADCVYGQGIVIPSALVPEMLAWVDEHVVPDYEHDDGRVGMWARVSGRGVYTTVPQLVRHAEGRSLMGHPPAVGLGTPLWAADRRDVKWDTESVQVPGLLFGDRGLRSRVAAPAGNSLQDRISRKLDSIRGQLSRREEV